jgi:hypothetical protein
MALAPVTITPTKPLVPSHIKGLLWLDLLYKSTSLLAETTYVWNPRAANLTAQTAAYWAYVDRAAPQTDWANCPEWMLGELYQRSHLEPADPAALLPYLERVEADGWVHPCSRRVIELWSRQLRLLNVMDPGLAHDRPLTLSTVDTLEMLREHSLLIDHRRFGGPAYLDGTRWGLPLRQVVTDSGHVNYLVPILRDLIPLVGRHDRIVLIFDRELSPDYVLLDRVLTTMGATVSRLALGRVPLDGVVRSTRYGGWEGRTLTDLAEGCLEHVDLATYRLGMRIYFIAVHSRGSSGTFRPDLLRRSLERASRLLSTTQRSQPDDGMALLRRMTTMTGYVDPYRLTTTLLGRTQPAATGKLARTLYL